MKVIFFNELLTSAIVFQHESIGGKAQTLVRLGVHGNQYCVSMATSCISMATSTVCLWTMATSFVSMATSTLAKHRKHTKFANLG